MTQGLLNILSVALIYCGTVFGAGFASGQEIFSFFSGHGFWGVFASVFAGVLFCILGFEICKRAKKISFLTIREYLDFLFPRWMSHLLHFVCSAFLVVTFCIMITGCGTLMCEQFYVHPAFGALVSLIICYVIIKNNVSGLAWFNGIVTPFMFVGVTLLCVWGLIGWGTEPEILSQSTPKAALVSGGLYVSYNMLSAAAVLVPATKISKNLRQATSGGAFGGLLVAIPLTLMTLLLARHPEVQSAQMPFFALVSAYNPFLRHFCSIILYCAMLTTAASSGVSVLPGGQGKFTKIYAILLCAVAFVSSFVPFAMLVKTMYTAFGICGILFILGIIKSFFRK